MRRTSFGAIEIGLNRQCLSIITGGEGTDKVHAPTVGTVQYSRQRDRNVTVTGMGDAEISQQEVFEFEFQWNSNLSFSTELFDFDHLRRRPRLTEILLKTRPR
jgi:hypothetical protein